MSNISDLSLTQIVNGIKKKDFTSEEVTKSFINNSKKSKKLNTYITECFEEAIKFAKNFDKKKDYNGLLSGVPIAVKDAGCLMDPPVSVPIVAGVRPAANAEAEPPEDPPGTNFSP